MTGLRPNPKPRFLWRAILIVLPVVVLASVGALSLRQDRLLAGKEANEQASQLADALLLEVAEVIAARFASALALAQAPDALVDADRKTIAIQITAEGDLLHPPRLSDPVPQPLDPADLDPEQGDLWQRARVAQFMDGWISRPLLDAAVELSERSELHATLVLQWRQLWTLHDRARQFHRQIRPQLESLLDEEPVGAKVIRTRHTAKGRGDAGAGRDERFNCQILRSDPELTSLPSR
jgi:hypothetical protein